VRVNGSRVSPAAVERARIAHGRGGVFKEWQGRTGFRTWALMLTTTAASVVFPDQAIQYAPIICLAITLGGGLKDFRLHLADILAIFLVAWAWASVAWAVDVPAASASAQAYTKVVAVFLVFRAVIETRSRLCAVAGAYVAGCLVAVGRVIYDNPAAGLPNDITAERFTVDGVNANFLSYAFVTGMALIVLLWTAWCRTFLHRALLILASMILCVGVVLTDTRGALIGVILLGAWVLLYRLSPRISLVTVVALLTLTAAGMVTGVLDQILVRLELITNERVSGTLSGRILVWPLARDTWRDHAIFGIGSGGFQASNAMKVRAHNFILQLGADLGLIGAALFVGVVVAALRRQTDGLSQKSAILVLGSFLVAVAPSYLSGAWEGAMPAWIALAIYSRLSVIVVGTQPQADAKSR